MRGQPRISSIYRMAAPSMPDEPDRVFSRIWAKCRDLWVEQGTIAVKPEELPEELRGPLVAWADDNYGERRN